MIYLVVDGASASSRCEKDKLATVVEKITGEIPYEIDRSLNKKRTFEKLDEFFMVMKENFASEMLETILIICKSQGAWRVLKYLKKHYEELNGLDILVLSIDPHHWAQAFVPRLTAVFPTYNFYQRNRWPKGQLVKDAVNILLGNKNVNHRNIIHNDRVIEMIKWFAS